MDLPTSFRVNADGVLVRNYPVRVLVCSKLELPCVVSLDRFTGMTASEALDAKEELETIICDALIFHDSFLGVCVAWNRKGVVHQICFPKETMEDVGSA